jgi:hypothetical protein
MDKEQQLNELVEEIRNRHLQPEDRYEIAALLESMGWNDERAAEIFGVDHVFELASDIWAQIQTNIIFTPFAIVEQPKLSEMVMTVIRQFLRGVIFALPMAVSVISMVFLKFSLWSYENLDLETATSIAIGTIISFIVVGGFTQAIARRGYFYIMLGYYNMGRRITFHFIGLGFIVCVAVSVFILLINMVFTFYPYNMLIIIILYFFFLNTIWLSVTVMYILQKELLFTGLIILGIGIVYTLFTLTGNIIISQLISLTLISICSILLVIYFFKRAEAKLEKGIVPKLPRMSITIYSTMPYFVYGFIYFCFLFVDRIVAWSTNETFMPYIIWFRGGYELGLDFALLTLIIPMGICEVVVSKLMTDLQASQKGYLAAEADQMNQNYLGLYYGRLVIIGAAAAISALAIYWTTWYLFGSNSSNIGSNLFSSKDPMPYFVFITSLVSYAIVAISMMNAVILFSLSQPHMVIRSLWPALLTNVILGFLLSRWFNYNLAVLGLLTGAIIFSVLSSRHVIRMFKKLDYYLYAAS